MPDRGTLVVSVHSSAYRRASCSSFRSLILDIEQRQSPCGARSRFPAQENPAHDYNPHETDYREDEPRIGAVWRPKASVKPRSAAQHAENYGYNPRPKYRVREQAGAPEPERPGHDQ